MVAGYVIKSSPEEPSIFFICQNYRVKDMEKHFEKWRAKTKYLARIDSTQSWMSCDLPFPKEYSWTKSFNGRICWQWELLTVGRYKCFVHASCHVYASYYTFRLFFLDAARRFAVSSRILAPSPLKKYSNIWGKASCSIKS